MDYTFPMSPPGVRIVNVRMTASFVRKHDGPHFARELDDDSEHDNICCTVSATILKLRYGIQYTKRHNTQGNGQENCPSFHYRRADLRMTRKQRELERKRRRFAGLSNRRIQHWGIVPHDRLPRGFKFEALEEDN